MVRVKTANNITAQLTCQVVRTFMSKYCQEQSFLELLSTGQSTGLEIQKTPSCHLVTVKEKVMAKMKIVAKVPHFLVIKKKVRAKCCYYYANINVVVSHHPYSIMYSLMYPAIIKHVYNLPFPIVLSSFP